MLKVITTVGTSIFDKYEEADSAHKVNRNYINKPFSGSDEKRNKREKEKIKKWINYVDDKYKISAEIKSLLKLKEEKKDEELDVYLLATDTVASSLAAEIVKEFLEKENFRVHFDPRYDVIRDLQVEDFDRFEKGKNNLINRISELIDEFVKDERSNKKRKFIRENVVFNITGGYKGIIPILTILAQLYEVRLFYVFEESSDAIAIPRIPINFDPFLLESLYVDIYLKKENPEYKFRNKDKLKEFEFIDRRNNITALGELFYKMAYTYNPLSPNVLGYFIEYKILEYLYSEEKKFKHSYSYKYKYKDEDKILELDFIFNWKTNEWEVWEVKSLGMFLNSENRNKVTEQFKKQLSNVNEIKKYRVIIYSITDAIIKKLKIIVQEIADKLKNEFTGVEIGFDFLWLKGMRLKEQDKNENPYQALFKYSIKKEHFKSLV